MKLLKALGLVICLAPAIHAAGPSSGSFSAGAYEAAKTQAKETGKPIAIVTTDTKSSCPKCQYANKEALKRLKGDYVLVMDDKAGQEKLPESIKQRTYPIYKSKGNIIPIIAVLSQNDEKLLGGLCYKQIADDSKKAFVTLKKETDEANAKTVAPAPAAKPTPVGGMRDWMNVEGKSIKAEAVSHNDTSVKLKLENGKIVDYPLDKLSPESRKLVSDTTSSN